VSQPSGAVLEGGARLGQRGKTVRLRRAALERFKSNISQVGDLKTFSVVSSRLERRWNVFDNRFEQLSEACSWLKKQLVKKYVGFDGMSH
jgi:hypothetical protein